MNQWKISCPNSETTVTAFEANINQAGALVLTEQSGQIIAAYAPGAWCKCEAHKGDRAAGESSQ